MTALFYRVFNDCKHDETVMKGGFVLSVTHLTLLTALSREVVTALCCSASELWNVKCFDLRLIMRRT